MKNRPFLILGLIILCVLPFSGYSQIVPDSRIIDWSNAGVTGGIPNYPVQHSVSDFGAVADGVTDNRAAFEAAIDATDTGNALLVPEGTYYLSGGIIIDKGIVLRGEGADRTIIQSDSDDSVDDDCILFRVQDEFTFRSLTYVDITAGGTKGSNIITVSDASSFAVGDYVQMMVVGANAESQKQHAEIEAINGNELTLNVDLYMPFPQVARIALLRGAGIESMHLKGLPGNTLNIKARFRRCAYSWMKDCETSGGNESVQYSVEMYQSYHCEFRGNYVHHSQEEANIAEWNLGYGFVSHHSTDLLIVDNAFDLVRPAVVHGNTSGGGVIAYNFAWDMVKYGRYDIDIYIDGHNYNNPYHWLTEGNNVGAYRNQNVPPMTVLRNKFNQGGFEIEGTVGMNIIGNQLDNPKWGTTTYMHSVGDDAIVHGNYTVHNGIGLEWDSDISDHNIPNSYYLAEKPEWFGDFAWPPFGGDLMVAGGGFNPNRIAAEVRYWTRRFPENVPANLSVVAVDETTNKLDWTSNSSAAGQVDKIDFIIVRSTNGIDFERIAITEQTSFTDTGLMPDRSYWYYVRARNHVTVDVAGGAYTWSGPGGESDPSNIVAVGEGILSVEQGDLTKNTLAVFPNPTSEALNFNLPDNQAQTISIYSGSGKLVKEEKYKVNSVSISGLEKGMYFLVVKGLRKSYHAKFIIE